MIKQSTGSTDASVKPRIGILGDGQLALMMTQAYRQIGGEVYVFGSNNQNPVATIADRFVMGEVTSAGDLSDFFALVDVVTLENEFIDGALLINAVSQSGTPLYPSPERYRLIEDKLSENQFFRDLGVEVADFFEVHDETELPDTPGYLKLSKGGYDGIGTVRVRDREQAVSVFRELSQAGAVLFEQQVEFVKELSLIAVAGADQQLIFYPLVETHQQEGTCRYVTFPAGVDPEVEQEAQRMIAKVMRAIDTRGLFAFELFLTADNQILLNESAPRPHNSGHITLDLMDCSQFENHMRAVAGLKLTAPSLVKPSATMINLLGTHNGEFSPDSILATVDDDPQATVLLYGKKQSRVKRKMGHINIWGENQWQRAEALVASLKV